MKLVILTLVSVLSFAGVANSELDQMSNDQGVVVRVNNDSGEKVIFKVAQDEEVTTDAQAQALAQAAEVNGSEIANVIEGNGELDQDASQEAWYFYTYNYRYSYNYRYYYNPYSYFYTYNYRYSYNYRWYRGPYTYYYYY